MRRMWTAITLMALAGMAQAAPKYFVQADVVRGAPGAQGAVCVSNSVFYPGEHVVWRAQVFDMATGKALTEAQVKAAGLILTATLDNGVKSTLNYEAHGAKKDLFWAGGWQTTAKTPTGTLKWTVTAKDKAGNTASFQPIGQDAGLAVLTVAAAKPASTTK